MSFGRYRRQDMEISPSLPLIDKLETNYSAEFKSPNTSWFSDQNVKSSTPLANEKMFENETTGESQPQADVENLSNEFSHMTTRDTYADRGQNEQPPTDWFGLAAPKFGTFIRSRIFVGGISSQTTEDELTNLFTQFGPIKASKIIVDRAGVSKGYGFVTFETERDSEALCNLIKNKEIGPITLRERRLNVAPAVKKQIGYRSDFPYPVSSVQPSNQVWRDGFFPTNGFTGQCMYYPQQPLAPNNQLEEYWQVQTQLPGAPPLPLPGHLNGGMSFQPCMPMFFAPQPYPFPNYPQVLCCLPDGMPSYSCPVSQHGPMWYNNFTQADPSTATQINNA